MISGTARRRFLQQPLMLALAAASGLALAATRSAVSATVVRAEIPTAGLSSSPKPLVSFVFVPPGAGRHPAVVMMHGCGGAYVHDGSLNARHRMWGELLAGQGYLALMLDSFTSRGIRQLCTQKFSQRTLKERDRAGDANAALVYLRGRPDVDAGRIALLGWSHGGGSVLAAISRPIQGRPGFAAAIAFYPGCTARAKAAESFHPYAPLLILIGEADDWTPAAPCRLLTSSVAARGEPMRILTYPGTYHDFDNPGLQALRVRKEVPNGVHPGQGVTIAPNATARQDAERQVLQFLSDTLSK
jgi:dienelactone hydrolase